MSEASLNETHTLDFNDIVRDIAKHQSNLEMIANERAKYLIVGRDQMRNLHSQSFAAQHLGSFQMPLFRKEEIDRRDGTRKVRDIYGSLEVILVPYIDGTFILPDVL